MDRLTHRISSYIKTSNTLIEAGVPFSSMLLFPLRRRWAHPRNQIDLKNGMSITSPPEEPLLTMFEEIWVNHCYTPSNFNIAPGHTIIDIGANVGVFTLWAAMSNSEVKVISLEPSPRICSFLRRNVLANGLHNVTVLQSACGGQREKAILYSRGCEAMNSLYRRDNYDSEFRPLTCTQVLLLGDVFQRFGVQVCDLLKLDCEGAEYEILFNAGQRTLQKVRRISMEYHVGLNEHTPEELARFLESQNFGVQMSPLLDVEGGYLYAERRI